MNPFIALIWLALILPLSSHGETTLRINTSIKPPFSTQDETGFFDRLLKAVAESSDLNIQLIRLPPSRALVSANAGISDGDLPRVGGLTPFYPNLVQVPEKLIDYQFIAFCNDNFSPDGWDSLFNRHVAYLLGWKIYEQKVTSKNVSKLRRPHQLFEMLAEARVDTVLYEKFSGQYIMNNMADKSIRLCGPALATKPMYLYLHKSQQHLVKPIVAEIKKMKEDGRYQTIFEQTLNWTLLN